MAIGLCLLFGFNIPENFRYPYTASSVREFWRRWHISLTTWMRDYLYIPLGGNRVSPARLYLNLFTVFLLTGFWHGARWNFLAWGAYHGAFLVAERILFTRKAPAPLRVLGHAYTIVVVVFGWVVFRTDTLPEAAAYMQAMLGMSQPEAGPATLGHLFNRMNFMTLALALLASAPVYPLMRRAIQRAHDAAGLSRWARFILAHSHYALLMSLFLASCLLVAIGTYNPFIYFRF
jgi:alginate O-acetyltransferase complex protein AlgI